MRPEPLIQRLEQEQAKLAHTALACPPEPTAFHYGKASGMYLGLAHAIDTIKNLEAEDEERGRNL